MKAVVVFLALIVVGVVFAADTSPPVIQSTNPANNSYITVSNNTLNITTDEFATCKYDNEKSGTAYEDMERFQDTNGASHETAISFSGNGTYNYYIKCRDAVDNENAEYWLHFILNQSGITDLGASVRMNLVFSIGSKNNDNVRAAPYYSLASDNSLTIGNLFAGSKSFESLFDFNYTGNDYLIASSQSKNDARFITVFSNASLSDVIGKASTVRMNDIMPIRFNSHTPSFTKSIKDFVRLEYSDIDITSRIFWDQGPNEIKISNNGIENKKTKISMVVQ